MARFRLRNGKKESFTKEEEDSADEEQRLFEMEFPLNEWKNSMRKSDLETIPRWLEDHIETDHDGVSRSTFLQEKYNQKKALRSTYPDEPDNG